MSLDQTIRQFMERFQIPEVKPLDWKGSAERLRHQFYVTSRAIEKDAPEMADVSHIMVPGAAGPRKARLYTPLGAGIAPGAGIVFFHGGGFVIGDLDSHDMLCRRLAEGARCRVVAIDYRLAPEHKFPAAHEDALAVWRWLADHSGQLGMDAERLAVSGDSAGGNLAAFLSQEMNRTGGPAPAFQLLLYPLVQFMDIRTKKMPVQESGFFISASLFEFFRDSYIVEEKDRMDLRVSPLFSPPEAFRGLPPAHFVLCGWDPLHDEGLAYADKMASFGVPVTVREYPGMVHGFMNLTALSEAIRDAIRDAGKVAGRALGAI
ncbi:MAG: alpha/beta hydrolase [Hyphomonas sp.]